MRRVSRHLRLSLAVLAWLAQLCLPIAHAAMMATPQSEVLGWCGDPARLSALVAAQQAESGDAFDLLDLDQAAPHPLDACAKLCATAFTPPPVPVMPSVEALRAAGLEVALSVPPAPRSRAQAPLPPAHAPPGRV